MSTNGRSRLFAIGLVVVLLSIPTNAGPIMGAGAQGCGGWVAVRFERTLRETTLRMVMLSWVQGYLTAALIDKPTSSFRVSPPGAESVALWLTTYCQQHPLDDVFTASQALVKDIIGER